MKRSAPGLGIAACSCGQEIPFVNNVLVNTNGRLRERLTEAARTGDEARATRIVLERYAARVEAMRRLGVRLTFNRFVRHWMLVGLLEGLGLRKLVAQLPPRGLTEKIIKATQFNLYIRHRFTAPSFLSMLPLLGLVEATDGVILDAPCGMGHLAYRISRLAAPDRIVCMDLLPPFAYASRRFFIPDALATIAHDMNEPLPLRAGRFSVIFCSDAFHYVARKQELAGEFMRLLREDGVLAMAHLHNRLQHNPVASAHAHRATGARPASVRALRRRAWGTRAAPLAHR